MNSDLCVALHALIYLDHKATTLSSEALAENICTNAARVRKVLAKLKDAGDVRTCAEIDGGYEFMGNAQKVTLADVARAIGGLNVLCKRHLQKTTIADIENQLVYGT
jgi:DNA-binding IscR family transcriptional regulator